MKEDAFAQVLIASNRGPVTFAPGEDGELVPTRGAGGLVTALTGSLQATGGLWVAAAMSDGDRAVSDQHGGGRIKVTTDDTTYELRFLSIAPDVYDGYYTHVSNRILWFVHHYLWDIVRMPAWGAAARKAWDQYVEVNKAFATALAEEAVTEGGKSAFLVQDYHLSLVPRFLRELVPDALIAHFSHTPIAGPTYTRILPEWMREGLLRGLLGADVLGFHSEAWAENFLMSSRSIPGARVDLARSRVHLDGREILARVHPISVDAPSMREASGSPAVLKRRQKLMGWKGDSKVILRVDRMELTKNILRGFLAYELFLQRNPQWKKKVKFLALLSPSREAIPEYKTYTKECLAEAERINRKLGKADWTPIEIKMRDDYLGAVAAYGVYDVLMVNPVFDGMNLVAMEGPVVNRRGGVLILSRNAGAYFRLGRYALPVNPFDIGDTADALETALTMPEDERTRRARGLSRLVLANPPARWVGGQLADLERVRSRRAWFQRR
ncbi:MAG: trehalose-6-phosphate synthase [Actinomycetota bacterium]